MFLFFTALAHPIDLHFDGVCDGSTGILTDSKQLLIAYDEDQSLHLYSTSGGPELQEISLSEGLLLTSERELDLEGSAQIDDIVWWVGSHGRNKDGKPRPNRQVFFSTGAQGDPRTEIIDLLPVLRRFAPLRKQLHEGVLARPPKRGGLNIEGLAETPEGELWLGLRSPLTASNGMTGEATLVRLKFTSSNRPKVRDVLHLNLQDRGVRSLTWDNNRLLILAGPVQAGGSFALYSYQDEGLTELQAPLAGLNPEALIPLDNHRYLVLSDDGAVERTDGTEADGYSPCKDIRKNHPQGAAHPSVFARGRIFTLPE